jgi:hypothetical protein
VSAYLTAMLVIHALGIGVTLMTKPGAPRKPEPSAGVLMVVLLLHVGLLAWNLWVRSGGAS